MKTKKIFPTISLVLVLCPGLVRADAAGPDLLKRLEELSRKVDSLTDTVKVQQRRISNLEQENDRLHTAALGSANVSAPENLPPPSASNSPVGAKPYLPEIGAVADIVANSTESKEDEEGNDRISARELELVLGHDVDPYTRLDATIAFSDFEDPALEEAYVSYSGLPWEANGRIGKYRPKFGKINALHRDSLDTVDEPLVVQHYLGAEGMSKAGLELSAFTPLSSDSFTQQLILGFMEGGSGEEGELLGETRRAPSYYARLSHFLDISEAQNLEAGASFISGSADEDAQSEVRGYGADLTWNYHLTPISKLKWQNEAIFQDRNSALLEDEEGNALRDNTDPWGFYSLLDLRFAERFGVGARYDWVEPVSVALDSEHSFDRALSGYLTFYQSEFARWRLQYQNLQAADGADDNRVWLQGTFAIGTHKHSIQ